MPLPGFEELCARADAQRPGVGVAAAGGADATVLAALRAACDRGWVVPLVAGRESEIRATADAAGIDLRGFTLLDSEAPAVAAVAAVRAGQARLLMKGQIATPQLLKAILDPDRGLRTGRVICQVVLMELPRAGRRFLLADTGITLRPTLEQKIDILRSTVAAAQQLGVDEPRVAVLAASESVNVQMPETVDAAELQRRHQAGELPGCVVQGPLSFDLAMAADAADKKRITGPVPGAADVLLFPDLLSANLTVKAIMYTADCAFGGILAGVAVPVVFMSRADTTATRLRSLALALAARKEA
jgi:phosphotransacetylase